MVLLGPLQRMLRVALHGACDGGKRLAVGNTANHSTETEAPSAANSSVWTICIQWNADDCRQDLNSVRTRCVDDASNPPQAAT